nr:7868_t:CDS:2 [Entrophospora candida]
MKKTYAVQKFWEEYKSICLDNHLTTVLNETKLQMAISDYIVNKSNEATIHSDLIGERWHQILKSKRKISSSLINEVTYENTLTQPTKKQKQSDVKPGIGDEGFEDAVDIKADAEDFFEVIVHDTAIEIDIPEDIKEYLCNLLSESIESALSKVEKPLNGDEKTWSNQTVYHIIDLFSMFFGELISGIAFGEIVNEVHKDRIYNVNVNQKPASSRRGDKNDAVLYQDQTAMIIYEQSFGPIEFDMTHYLEDITKLAHNGVDDLNYHFIQYDNSSITTAKKLNPSASMDIVGVFLLHFA